MQCQINLNSSTCSSLERMISVCFSTVRSLLSRRSANLAVRSFVLPCVIAVSLNVLEIVFVPSV